MSHTEHWMQRLTEGMALYGESLPGVPVVEIAGGSRVLIERHAGVIEYGKEQIQVQVGYGRILVRGVGLRLTRMTREQVIIAGLIQSVELQRR